jgi:hypothetical protein
MKVRRGGYKDIGEVVSFMQEYHADSNLADIPFVRKDAAKTVEYFIASKYACPLVAENDEGELIGILFASLEPYFFNSKYKYATDLQFISKGAGIQLLAEFKRWARQQGAERIVMGVSSGDARADAFLELSGSEKIGNMYVIRI